MTNRKAEAMNEVTKPDQSTALAIPEGRSLAAMFSEPSQVDDLITRLEAEALSHAPDLSTAKGRKAIASLAYKIAQSKTALDKAGKSLADDARAKINAVDTERRKIRDRLDALKEKVRKPLDDWEAAEEARVQALKDRLERLRTAHTLAEDAASEAIASLISRVEETAIDDTWAEFIADASKYKDQALVTLRDMHQRAVTREDEKAELSRLRAEAEARELADRERREAEEAERRRVEAEKAEAERQARIEREKAEAVECAARKAEERAKRAAEEREAQHRRELEEVEERAKRAAEEERQRHLAQQKAEQEARAKRESDEAHRAKVAHDISEALRAMSGKATPEAIAEALMAGKIPHVQVNL